MGKKRGGEEEAKTGEDPELTASEQMCNTLQPNKSFILGNTFPDIYVHVFEGRKGMSILGHYCKAIFQQQQNLQFDIVGRTGTTVTISKLFLHKERIFSEVFIPLPPRFSVCYFTITIVRTWL